MNAIKRISELVLLPVLGAVILALVLLALGTLILILSIPATIFTVIAAVFKVPRDLLNLLLKGFLDGVAQSIAHGGAGSKEKQ